MITTRRTAPTALKIALAGTLAVTALAACGDDTDDEATGDTARASASEAGGNAEFCDAFLALDQAFAQAPEDPAQIEDFAAENITPNLTAARETVPDELSSDVATMADAVDTFVAGGGDFAALDTPEFAEAAGRVYPELEAGPTVFSLTNDSDAGELHEMAIMKLKDGVDLTLDELLALPEDEAQQHVESPPTGAFAPPGASGGTTVELTSGRYVYVCFIPVGTTLDAEGSGPPHFMEGMAGEFTVE
jgi:hypothetical protein